jgi:hypothetical protein
MQASESSTTFWSKAMATSINAATAATGTATDDVITRTAALQTNQAIGAGEKITELDKLSEERAAIDAGRKLEEKVYASYSPG